MLAKLRAEDASEEDRKWAAQNAAPYVHPRLATMALQHDVTDRVYDWLIGG